ncbi:hypothetical protein [Streptomyces spiramenti]|uniref:Uncharacterized protein n=1 Tax=Streptomyces spiramenti TaxID=2720606 RepID=A0ABX1AK05_9ACTN|nr:hypothetical protein [Streptomyces spiramenti]NJP66331.1 hypothetical protein [Streptomyces spiramenti]
MSRERNDRRTHFEPARLLLGLCLLAIAAGFAARTAGTIDVQLRYLAGAVPVALLLTAVVSVVTYAVRRRRDRRCPPGRSGD